MTLKGLLVDAKVRQLAHCFKSAMPIKVDNNAQSRFVDKKASSTKADTMKTIFLFFAFQIAFLSSAQAECNLKLTIAAGQYIEELEKIGATKYQNNSVCEVLDYEIGKCSATQKAKIEKAFNVKEVHRNYCQPHLPQAEGLMNKEAFMKGAELYSWKDFQGFQWYTILPGTNRSKTTQEITAAKNNEWQLLEKLKQLPPSTEISWNNVVHLQDQKTLEFSIPSKDVIKKFTKAATEAKLKLSIAQ